MSFTAHVCCAWSGPRTPRLLIHHLFHTSSDVEVRYENFDTSFTICIKFPQIKSKILGIFSSLKKKSKKLVNYISSYLTKRESLPLLMLSSLPEHKRTKYLLPNNGKKGKVKVKEIFEISLRKDLLFKINEREAVLVTFVRKRGRKTDILDSWLFNF